MPDAVLAVYAQVLAHSRSFLEDPPLPVWAQHAMFSIRNLVRSAYPDVDEIELRGTWEPRLNARAIPSRKSIIISLVTRDILRSIDIAILNRAFAGAGQKDPLATPTAWTAGYALGPLLPLYLDAPWSLSPMLRPSSEAILGLAINAASNQCVFMLAHEVAHALLHAGSHPSPQNEAEADDFACWVVYRLASEGVTVGDIWMASKWLFEIHSVDRGIALRLAGGTQDIPPISPERIAAVDKYGAAFGVDGLDLMYGRIGSSMLLEMRQGISASSPEDIRLLVTKWLHAIYETDIEHFRPMGDEGASN